MKKIGQILGVLALVLFSFYYTEKVVSIFREKDPIMKAIREKESEYQQEAVDAKLIKNHVIPGARGKKVDVLESYKKMKNYGKYKESLFVFQEIEPTVSLDDYYDRYIESGNGLNSGVALVFRVERFSNINPILSILEARGEKATFFADGLWIENNQQLVQTMTTFGHEVEVLYYNGSYDENYFKSAIAILESITAKKKNYCYAEYDQKEVLDLCGKMGIHTVIPTLQVKAKPYIEIKKKVSAGSIISMKVDAILEEELDMVIRYLNQKGFYLTNLDDLLSEK